MSTWPMVHLIAMPRQKIYLFFTIFLYIEYFCVFAMSFFLYMIGFHYIFHFILHCFPSASLCCCSSRKLLRVLVGELPTFVHSIFTFYNKYSTMFVIRFSYIMPFHTHLTGSVFYVLPSFIAVAALVLCV